MTTIARDVAQRKRARSDTDNGESVLIAEWPLKHGEIARVSVKKYKGTWLLDIRKFFENESGDYNPSSKGIAFSIKHLHRANAAVAEALAVARQRGLISMDQEGAQ